MREMAHPISPIHNTKLVEAISATQVGKLSGTTRKAAPPKVTMRICPIKIAAEMDRK